MLKFSTYVRSKTTIRESFGYKLPIVERAVQNPDGFGGSVTAASVVSQTVTPGRTGRSLRALTRQHPRSRICNTPGIRVRSLPPPALSVPCSAEGPCPGFRCAIP